VAAQKLISPSPKLCCVCRASILDDITNLSHIWVVTPALVKEALRYDRRSQKDKEPPWKRMAEGRSSAQEAADRLTVAQCRVTQEGGTERLFTGEYNEAIVVTDQAAGKAWMKLVERRPVETGNRRPVALVPAIRGRVLRHAKRPTTLLSLC